MIVSEFHKKAALDNAVLCAAIWRAHGLGVEQIGGCSVCSGTPPRFYPNIVTTDPSADVENQRRLISERAEATSGEFYVKDSYQTLALDRLGFKPLFDASWIHRIAGKKFGETRLEWRRVMDPNDELRAWENAWSNKEIQSPIFRPAFLSVPGITILAGRANGAIIAGCVVTAEGTTAGVSNVFGEPSEVLNGVAELFSAYDLVGYENGEALAAFQEQGFTVVGGLTVWAR
jgi:hypothetical protein